MKNKTLELPLLITKETIILPSITQSIGVGRKISSKAVYASKDSYDSLIFATAQKNADVNDITSDDVYQYGSLCRIISLNQDRRNFTLRIISNSRVRFTNIYFKDDCFFATGEILENETNDQATLYGYLNRLLDKCENLNLLEVYKRHEGANINIETDFYLLAYTIIQFSNIPFEEKFKALTIDKVGDLFDLASKALDLQQINLDIEKEINSEIRSSSEQAQKEYFLRERLKAIKKEINGNENEDRSDSIKKRLEQGQYPENIKSKILSELQKAEMMPPGSLETSLIQNYIDTLLNLPWWQKTIDNDDISNVKKILDEDHYGLAKVKKRIVEYLAVKQLTGNLKSPILCFYGPPGCGKTSLGRSIARALGRKFVKASLGGISDEAEIRGHRRTYVGSMPGRIIAGMKKAGVTNPVFLLDEVDKLGSSYKGDPSSALLEVLDPEQNFAFNDNFIEEPYDLSDVLFVCTANYLENVPAPLRDRLELIEVNSYTSLEKIQIAKQHLIKKQLVANGLLKHDVKFNDDAIAYVIEHYTREAGVRELERQIASCLRKTALHFVENPKSKSITINISKVKEYLGTEIFDSTKKESIKQIGVVTGLAYTEYGGDILPIEVTYFKGKGGLVLTGHLGDVMKESATIALDYVRANAKKYGIDEKIFIDNDVHIHVPEGAVPKDGPSAGIAITTAIISCLSKTPIDPNIAMTGEVTLRGHALPIGGLREKSLAALRAGIKTIIVPIENKKTVEELPEEVKNSLNIVFMKNVDDALKVALIKE